MPAANIEPIEDAHSHMGSVQSSYGSCSIIIIIPWNTRGDLICPFVKLVLSLTYQEGTEEYERNIVSDCQVQSTRGRRIYVA